MKKIYLIFLLPFFAVSQNSNDLVVYLDSLEQIANEDNYYVLRVMKDYYSENPGCLVYDFYKSGEKKSIGKYTDKYNLLKAGEYISYYENGNKSSLFHFDNNQPIGKFYTWYEKGNIKSEGEFIQFKNTEKSILKVNHYWSRIGIHRVIDGKGHYEDEGITWYSEGELLNGLQDGDWTGFDVVNKSSFTEKYKAGILISGISIDSLKKTYQYKEIEELTNPKVKKVKFYKYLKNNIKIPAYIIQNKLSGALEVSFTINKEGWITNTKVSYGMGYGLEAEIIRVFNNSDQWNPAKKRGIPYESQLTIPFSIYNGKL